MDQKMECNWAVLWVHQRAVQMALTRVDSLALMKVGQKVL
jgi:hypothetical protein